jgi:hypothetical protein
MRGYAAIVGCSGRNADFCQVGPPVGLNDAQVKFRSTDNPKVAGSYPDRLRANALGDAQLDPPHHPGYRRSGDDPVGARGHDERRNRRSTLPCREGRRHEDPRRRSSRLVQGRPGSCQRIFRANPQRRSLRRQDRRRFDLLRRQRLSLLGGAGRKPDVLPPRQPPGLRVEPARRPPLDLGPPGQLQLRLGKRAPGLLRDRLFGFGLPTEGNRPDLRRRQSPFPR